MVYQITPTAGSRPRYVAVLVATDLEVVSPGSEVFPACEGDRRGKLGLNDCSRQTVRLTPGDSGDDATFELIVRGSAELIASSIAIKKARVERCEIGSLGPLLDRFDPFEQITTSQSRA